MYITAVHPSLPDRQHHVHNFSTPSLWYDHPICKTSVYNSQFDSTMYTTTIQTSLPIQHRHVQNYITLQSASPTTPCTKLQYTQSVVRPPHLHNYSTLQPASPTPLCTKIQDTPAYQSDNTMYTTTEHPSLPVPHRHVHNDRDRKRTRRNTRNKTRARKPASA